VALIVAAVVVVGAPALRTLAAADRTDLSGRWTFNPNLSHLSKEVGFGMDVVSGPDSVVGGRSRSGGGGTGASAMAAFRESVDDAKRKELLVDEVTSPSPHLTIVQTEAAITFTDDRGRSRTLHPDGREESLALGEVGVATTSRWNAGHLEVRYQVEQNRELRYTYSRTLEPPQLVVQVKFIERGGHDEVTLVYEPSKANEPVASTRTALPEFPKPLAGPPPGAQPPPAPSTLPSPIAPARAPTPVGAPGPDAELRGLATLGLVVEGLDPQPTCGLSEGAVESAVAKDLLDAGFKVRRNSDEDTYVYINIITTNVSPTLCVSRYDAYLYSYTTTTLSYQTTPALVQVSLLHKGGLAGGAPATHADTVLRNVKQYVDEFVSRIRAANR
jgi:hypothetical protein